MTDMQTANGGASGVGLGAPASVTDAAAVQAAARLANAPAPAGGKALVPAGAKNHPIKLVDEDGFAIIEDGLDRIYAAAVPGNLIRGYLLRTDRYMTIDDETGEEREVEHLVVRTTSECTGILAGKDLEKGETEKCAPGRTVHLGVRHQLKGLMKRAVGPNLWEIKVKFVEQKKKANNAKQKVWQFAVGEMETQYSRPGYDPHQDHAERMRLLSPEARAALAATAGPRGTAAGSESAIQRVESEPRF